MPDNLLKSQAVSGVNRMIKTIKNLESQQGFPLDIAFATVSNPPTTGEINAAFATPSDIGIPFVGLLVDVANSRNWLVFTDGVSTWYVVNRPQQPLTLTSLLTTAGITNVGTITHTGETRLTQTDLILANGDNNDIVLPANTTYVRATGPTANYAITGIAGGASGRLLFLFAAINQQLTIKNNSVSSAGGNRIATGTGADLVVTTAGGATIIFMYESTNNFWRIYSARGIAGAV